MPIEKPPKAEIRQPLDFVQGDVSDWFRQFLKHLELYFNDVARTIPADAGEPGFRLASLRAVLATLLDSGMELESFMEAAGQVAMEHKLDPVVWTDAMNQRRFALIDGEIQGILSPAEKVELAALTSIMRQHVESELNLPMEGARALHRKLLDLYATDESH